MVTYEDLRKNAEINTYITRADESLSALGFTEHSFPHVCRVAEMAGETLGILGYGAHEIELAKIAAYLHDIGNLVNRVDHSQSGAVMAFRLLDHMDMDAADIATVVTAIGNHDEGTGVPVNAVAAALILADKSDVRRSRVRNTEIATFDIHDRVNYAVKKSALSLSADQKVITLEIEIDPQICAVMNYFEIFLGRMVLCRRAAEFLKLRFSLVINGSKLL